MATKIITIILVCCADLAISQFETMYMRSDTRGVPYEKTRQEILNNFLSNKPLLNYAPVYSTDYGFWDTEKQQKTEPVKKSQVTYQTIKPKVSPDVDLQKLSEVLNKLKVNMQALSQTTKIAYEDKLKELNEVKRMNDDLKIALHNADILKNSLYEHDKQLSELTKNIQDRTEFPGINPSGIEEFLNMIESLELMVRNISYKYGGKLGM